MERLQGLSVIAADAIASKIAKPKAYTNAKFIILILISVFSFISAFALALMSSYTAMVEVESIAKLNALLTLSGASFVIALLASYIALRIYKKEELIAFIRTKNVCETAIQESLQLVDNDLSKPIKENPMISLAIACIAGAVIGKKF